MAVTTESTPLTTGNPEDASVPSRSPRSLSRRKRILLHVAGLASLALVVSVAVVLIKGTSRSTQTARLVRSHTSTVTTAASSVDEIVAMPGKPESYTSRLFSGYLPLQNGGEGFYFFAESQSETPEKDPVLLWLNGGPGASSLGGCFTENGPLLVNEDGETLRVNEYGWNKNANFVCVESPVGVGFTYNASGIYKSDDIAQADDLYWMLQSFFDKFPWLRANDFVISGESYGGIYVPMTAKRIVEGNRAGDAATHINLKKFVVGNGVNEFTTLSKIAFAYFHGLIPTEAYVAVDTACPGLLVPPINASAEVSDACTAAVMDTYEQLQALDVNTYNIYAKCNGGDPMAGLQSVLDELNGPLQPTPRPIGLTMALCLDFAGLNGYLNQPSVRTALHTKSEVGKWNDVSLTSANFDLPSLLNKTAEEIEPIIKNKVLQYDANQQMNVTPLWKLLLDSGVEGVIYHGDVDMTCDFVGGLWAVESLGLPRQQKRAAWHVEGADQTAGFVEDFGALKYVTVKGAGHMVPSDKPKEAKALLDQFVF